MPSLRTRRAAAAVAVTALVAVGASSCSSRSTGGVTSPGPAVTPAAGASTAAPVGASVLYGEDQAAHSTGMPALSDYQGLWNKLGQACSDDPPVIQQAIERVFKVQREPNRYEAMRYMVALASGPQTVCANFDADATGASPS